MRNMILAIAIAIIAAVVVVVPVVEQLFQIGLIDFLIEFIPLDTPCL